MMQFSELRAVLSPVIGSTLAQLEAVTHPYVPGHPKGSIAKRQSLKVAIFFGPAYGMLTGQPVGPRTWGERQGETPYILHKGEAYLECFIIEESAVYEKLGRPIDPSELRLRERDEMVKLRCFKLENIQSINLV